MAATYYSFSETAGTNLSAISGWTRESSEERLSVSSVNGLRRLGTSAGVTQHFYREGTSASGTQRAGLTFTTTGNTSPHVVLFGSWSGGTFSGYAVYPSNATTLAVRKYTSGTGATTGTITVTATAGAWEIEAVNSGGNTTIKAYQGGVQQGSTVTDSSSPFSSGYNGIYLEGTTSATSNVGDDFYGNIQDSGGGGSPATYHGLLLGVG